MLTSPEGRGRFIAGLRELADYLAVHEDVPVPDYPKITAHADGADDAEEREMVDKAARGLRRHAAETRPGSGHYKVVRYFGPLEYGVAAISRSCMELHEAQQSYVDNITATA
ncbi:MAG: hypothetical protein J2P25_16050 [Nocardiopsaceae bacterium]|nr:hypothetical protein [Nocardiopsaceae bacterium]